MFVNKQPLTVLHSDLKREGTAQSIQQTLEEALWTGERAKTKLCSRLDGEPRTKEPDPAAEFTHAPRRQSPNIHKLAQTQHMCKGRKLLSEAPAGVRCTVDFNGREDSSSLCETHILSWAVTQSRVILVQGKETRAPL